MDNHSEELFSIDLEEVAKLYHHFAAIHVCSDSDPVSKENHPVDGNLESFSRGLCKAKQVKFTGSTFLGSLARILKRVTRHCAAMAVIVGSNPEDAFRYCVSQFSTPTAVLSIREGKIILESPSIYRLAGFKLYSRPNLYLKEDYAGLRDSGVSVIEETSSHVVGTSKAATGDCFEALEDGNFRLSQEFREVEAPLSSISPLLKDLPEVSPGWPLLRRVAPVSPEASRKSEARKMSVVQWAMSLPNRSNLGNVQAQIESSSNESENSFRKEIDNSMAEQWEIGKTSLQLQAVHNSEDKLLDGSTRSTDGNFGQIYEDKAGVSLTSISFLTRELPQSMPGWPLLKKAVSATPGALKVSEVRKMSVVQWVMSLPNRPTPATLQSHISSSNLQSTVEQEISFLRGSSNLNFLSASRQLPKELELHLKTNSTGFKWFSHEELKSATSQFSSDNLIGEGGCSSVYKGCIPCGKPLAIKISKLYKEAWNDFSLEVDIVSSLKHRHIPPLIGVCIEDDYLISVYDFLPGGSLEEILHGNRENSVLPWELRFKVAMVVAEALNYLHNECPRPVIHRDIKSSNILFSDEYQPKLSDFGLAVWGPPDSAYLTDSDVVGTFGYIAPEYFMHGRVSDKVDVYSFGVVLLELLSGRRPISSETLQGQASLVKWAKSILDRGDPKLLLDPKLDGKVDVVQMQRMVLAASLCVNRSARLRPNVSQVQKLLRGEKDAEDWVEFHLNNPDESVDHEDELYLQFGSEPHSGFALLDLDNDSASLSNAKPKAHFSLGDYLNGRAGQLSSHCN